MFVSFQYLLQGTDKNDFFKTNTVSRKLIGNGTVCKELLLGITIVEEPLFRTTCHNPIFKFFK
jgi:hypothetical protein